MEKFMFRILKAINRFFKDIIDGQKKGIEFMDGRNNECLFINLFSSLFKKSI